MWKRATTRPAGLPPEVHQRLGQLEQAVDTVAVEMERVSEGQRFLTKLLMEPNAVASIEARQRDALGIKREAIGARPDEL
jgi:hypothetical protein